MKILDVNLLIYAVNRDAPLHAQAKSWLEKSLVEEEPLAFCWVVVLAFVRLTTRPGLFQKPLSIGRAFDVVEEWLGQPAARIVEPGLRHSSILRELLTPLGAAGNLTSDAHLAALAIEQNAQVYSCDSDFSRFPRLRWKNPLNAR